MVETLEKVRRDFASADRKFLSVVFLRNDIYELMVNETPDRGKSGRVLIDWSDSAKLRHVIFKRLRSSTKDEKSTFEEIWSRFFCENVDGQPSFEYLVSHCLMRPRFLLNIIDGAIANAINRGHTKVGGEDCQDAVRQNSYYIIDEFGYEMRDVSKLPADILYALVGSSDLLTDAEIVDFLNNAGVDRGQIERAVNLLLWYGVLGIASKDNEEKYIYDYDYNFKRLEAEIRSVGTDRLYPVNPALRIAL